MILAPTYVVFAHSGHYILNDNDAYHAIHHRDLNVNFGSIILDKIAHTFKPE
jgi:sterol desaturase/sphingolipid hydroxylase (fatty acid hydroxylase superfamily)